MTKLTRFQTGNYVRVETSTGKPGDTLYEIVALGFGTDCMIREVREGTAVGKQYAPQQFDTTLLVKA